MLFNTNFDFNICIVNGVAFDVVKCAPPDKVMQGTPCLEVRTFTNENGRYMMKSNDCFICFISYLIHY